VEGCLELGIHYKECQPFPQAGWKPDAICTGYRRGVIEGVVFSAKEEAEYDSLLMSEV